MRQRAGVSAVAVWVVVCWCAGVSSVHPRRQKWALTGMNRSHKTAQTNLDRKQFSGRTRQIFLRSARPMGRSARPDCALLPSLCEPGLMQSHKLGARLLFRRRCMAYE